MTYDLRFLIDQLGQILLGQRLLTTSLLNSFSNGNIDLWGCTDIVFTIELGDTGMIGIGVASISGC
jgi:hypothetical protein